MSDGGQLRSFYENLLRNRARVAGAESDVAWLDSAFVEPGVGDVAPVVDDGSRVPTTGDAFTRGLEAFNEVGEDLVMQVLNVGPAEIREGYSLGDKFRDMGRVLSGAWGVTRFGGGNEYVSPYEDASGVERLVAGFGVPDAGDVGRAGAALIAGVRGLGDTRLAGEVGDVVDRLFGRSSEFEPSGLRVEPGRYADEPVVYGAPLHTVRTGADEVQYRALQAERPEGRRTFSEPVPEAVGLANSYRRQNQNLLEYDVDELEGGGIITALDADHQRRIADAFEAAPNDPTNPEVRAAYEALVDETLAQYDHILRNGNIRFELWDKGGEPYANSAEMLRDVRENGHMYVLATEAEFGADGVTAAQRAENPLLQPSGYTDVNGREMLANDVFRGVHDFFGHSVRGNSFGAVGEENAWAEHASMFSPLARRAMTTETRGQNSWVNYGPQMRSDETGLIMKPGDEGFLPVSERSFSEQKMTLLPEWVSDPFLILREASE